MNTITKIEFAKESMIWAKTEEFYRNTLYKLTEEEKKTTIGGRTIEEYIIDEITHASLFAKYYLRRAEETKSA